LGFVAIGAATTISLGSYDAAAQSVLKFYKGKTITFLMPYPPGGSYDAYTRMVQAHIKKYIPGAPNIIVQNMGGGRIVFERQ
jgi:tripartite-type tricarboxylate transporter receptor subunit TctC